MQDVQELPKDIEAEKRVIGSILLENKSILKIIDFIEPTDFYKIKHQYIYQSAQELHNNNIAIDLVTLTNYLKEKEILIKVGGASYLSELIVTTPTAANIKHHANIIKDKSAKRRIIDSCEKGLEEAYSDSTGNKEIIDNINTQIQSINHSVGNNGYTKWLKTFIERERKRIERSTNVDNETIMTFIRDKEVSLDEILNGGLNKGTLTCVVADTKKGKSTFATHMQYVAFMQGKNVLHIFHEGTMEQAMTKLDSRFFNVPYDTLYNFDKTEKQQRKVKRKHQLFMKRKEDNVIMKYYPPNRCSANEIRNLCKQLRDTEGWIPDLIIDDYADFMIANRRWQQDDKHRLDSIYEDVIEIITDLYGDDSPKMNVSIAFLTFSQAKAGFVDKKLTKNAAGGSIGKSQRVTTMLGLYNLPEDEASDIPLLRLKVLASRFSEAGSEIILYPDMERNIMVRDIIDVDVNVDKNLFK